MKEKRGNGFGIAGFVLGMIGLILFWFVPLSPIIAIVGIILSSIQIKKNSTGLAIAGLILSIITFISSLLVIAMIILALSVSTEFDINNINETVVLVKTEFEYLEGRSTYKEATGGSGVIYYNQNGIIRIITNRHVADCSYTQICGQLTNQLISVRMIDGKTFNVSKVYLAREGLDLAVLEIESSDNYPAAKISSNINMNDPVVAIGYPSFASNAREFSIAFGEITRTRNLLTNEGFSFEAIDSNAYTYFGSSGGGLFDKSGNLIGITTWGDDYHSYAINIRYLLPLSEFNSCKENEYYYEGRGCLPYCSGIINDLNQCVYPCNDFYCNSDSIDANDNRCIDPSLVLGLDGFCHKACGSATSYCPGEFNYCFDNKCTSCPSGYILYEDGNCY
jgi:hypothetical protein